MRKEETDRSGVRDTTGIEAREVREATEVIEVIETETGKGWIGEIDQSEGKG